MPTNLTWNFNPNYSDLSATEVGDLVIIHADNVWQYSVRADVLEVKGSVVTAVVVDIFDRITGMPIHGGEVTAIIGGIVAFELGNVFSVVKNPN